MGTYPTDRAADGPSSNWMAAPFTSPQKLLRIADVQARVGLSRSAIYRQEKAGLFPSRRKIGRSRVVWFEKEIEAWIEALPKGGARG